MTYIVDKDALAWLIERNARLSPRPWRALPFALVLILVIALPGCQPVEGPKPGEPAPPVVISEWVKGGPYDVNAGNAIYVLDFWATWCPPCRDSIPHMTELQHAFAEKGVVVIGITQEEQAVVRAFVEDQGDAMDYAVAIDGDYTTARAYGISSIPHAFVIDRQGMVAWRGHPQKPGLERTLNELTRAER